MVYQAAIAVFAVDFNVTRARVRTHAHGQVSLIMCGHLADGPLANRRLASGNLVNKVLILNFN